jgi:HD-GYP domain
VARHIFEFVGIAVVGASLVFDLRRGRRSRALVGDLRAAEIVASEEAYLGARVRALMVRLAAKDTSTEEHTRRVAALAVEVGEQLGLSPTRLRSLAIGGSCTTSASSRSRPRSSRSPGRSTTTSSQPSSSTRSEAASSSPSSAASTTASGASSSTTTSASTAAGIRAASRQRARSCDRILAVCDVYDALVSTRVYRPAWTRDHALELLRGEADVGLDARCVTALERVLDGRTAVGERSAQVALRLVTSAAQ